MTTGPTLDPTKSVYAPNESRRAVALPGRFEEPIARQQRLQRTGERDPWSASHQTPGSLSLPPPGLNAADRARAGYAPFPSPQATRWSQDPWSNRQNLDYHDAPPVTQWPISPLATPYSDNPMSPSGEVPGRSGYIGMGWQNSWPGPLLRRTSSDDARLNQLGGYYGNEANSSSGSLQNKAYPQRRPSNRDEFDGPSQLLDKPNDSGYEPKEEDLPQLPITLYAQEQDEILSKVNDRLSQCAFDFVARYQFPIPIEPDKRPVRVPADREWSEWVYLLKRLATKRRIPARVLFNGQIKQLITILENSLEMRHAAKHQSRPLKDDRNILQLISSGLQVAKIVKDAPAMQYLDSLYVQTERLIGSRRVPVPATTYAG
ncbi:hypothetical protein EJ03DRAFT_332350 [Teratosphaeria nubilosa]|uniref:Uncharacterized protein n=1 Tax=Teratosphaeria nubilosa TaxID=161662 RepID=A0A6G1KU94_9PEZI|nr:hypothetical protein EJ03DRAFT_332350 [Teratosphaeria nubilosa]